MSERTPLVAGNWKLHKTIAQSTDLVDALVPRLATAGRAEIVVAPVFTALAPVAGRLQGSRVALAAQDLYWEAEGAFTGAVGPLHLQDVGCRYVIVGHSERRQYFGETDANVSRKALAALAHGLLPIVCVGETLQTREAGKAYGFVVDQVQVALASMDDRQAAQTVIAYEPIWAIGSGRTASPADAQQMHATIRAEVGRSLGAARANSMRILYGGSVKPGNAADLMSQTDVDGALVGGASLDAESFAAVIDAAEQH